MQLPRLGVRRHGLQKPLGILQGAVVFIGSFDTLLFCVICVPTISAPVSLIVGLSYGLVVLSLACAALKVSWSDPSALLDPATADAKLPFCSICNVHQKERTEHCNACNRCTAGFDHHCIWLNNCVGSKNYHAFVASLILVVVMTVTVIATCIGLVVEVCRGSSFSNYDDLPKGVLVAVYMVLLVLNIPLLVLDLNLALFHILIVSKGMTTLEYMRACNAWEKNRALNDEESFQKLMQQPGAFQPFPYCVDWVIFRRRGPPRPKLPKTPPSAKVSPSKVAPVCEVQANPSALVEKAKTHLSTSPAIQSSDREAKQEVILSPAPPDVSLGQEVQKETSSSTDLPKALAVDEAKHNDPVPQEEAPNPQESTTHESTTGESQQNDTIASA